jgi:CRISPR-associated exonuclease Cas4
MTISPGMILAALVLGLFLLLLARAGRRASGLPAGQVIYRDTGAGKQEQPLFSKRHRLIGRPDYLIHREGRLIPVEVKSGRGPEKPYKSHILQLAAYCLLVEEVYGRRPPYGVIRYNDCVFEVDYTKQMEAELLAVVAQMRASILAPNVRRSHNQPFRCARCGYREMCEESLAPAGAGSGVDESWET